MEYSKDAAVVAQRIVALDTQYNPHRPLPSNQYRLLYLKRRNQLLQDNIRSQSSNAAIRKHYLQLRGQLLAACYGPLDNKRLSSTRVGSSKSSALQSEESLPLATGGNNSSFLSTPPRHSTPSRLMSGLVPTRSAEASRAMAGNTSLSSHYAFCGMHHIFDTHRDAVTVIRFGHDDRSCMACGSMDGTISIFTIAPEPPTLRCTLRGHSKGVVDLDWSVGNDFIISASHDGTYRLWDSNNGRCLREIEGQSNTQATCCRLHPHNGNLLITGNSKGQIRVHNLSTGKAIKGGNSKTAGAVLSISLEKSGGGVWAADSKGSVFSFFMDPTSGRMQRTKRIVVSSVPITSVSCRSWISREARDPSLLISCADNTLRLYRIMVNGEVYLKRQFQVPHSTQNIHSAFCPLMSFLQGACVVSGGEDGRVYLYDVETGVQVNTLQGHSCPVLDVAWSYDESLLASCDLQGTIILWKRGTEGSQVD